MSNEIEIFNNTQFGNIRVSTDERGEPWFVASDVCRVLALTNPSEAVKCLDDDEKGLTNSYTLGGMQEMLTINESGLYTLIFRSTKPSDRCQIIKLPEDVCKNF